MWKYIIGGVLIIVAFVLWVIVSYLIEKYIRTQGGQR